MDQKCSSSRNSFRWSEYAVRVVAIPSNEVGGASSTRICNYFQYSFFIHFTHILSLSRLCFDVLMWSNKCHYGASRYARMLPFGKTKTLDSLCSSSHRAFVLTFESQKPNDDRGATDCILTSRKGLFFVCTLKSGYNPLHMIVARADNTVELHVRKFQMFWFTTLAAYRSIFILPLNAKNPMALCVRLTIFYMRKKVFALLGEEGVG